MKKLMLILFLCFVVGIIMPSYAALEKGSDNNRTTMAKPTVDERTVRTLVNVGQVAMWIESDGISATYPFGALSGFYYPRGSTPSTAFIYQDGFLWGGLVQDGITPEIRVGGQTYASGCDPGAIISKGVAEDDEDRENVWRIWRIRRDFATVPDDALTQDASEFNDIAANSVTAGDIQALRALYREDWVDWPAHKGAPFYDADGDGEYNPQFYPEGHEKAGQPMLYPDADEPGYANGDQVVWFVCNDLNPSTQGNLYVSPPIGLEMQATLWAYKRTDAMGFIIFKEFRLIYKGREETPADAYIDSMFVCQWSDPDLGQSGDDFAGCDTVLSLGYAYNANAQDQTYQQAGYPPPAGGYDFFAGPRVPEIGGQAIWHLNVIDDYVNLPMTSFAFFAAGQDDSDPTLRDYQGTLQWWNLLRGYRPRPVTPPERWKDPEGNVTMFRVPGDPVSGTGWIDSNTGDRRILLVSGPFTMSLNDTTETVVAVMGGLGSDRLSSISVLKFYDRFAQEAFDVAFDLPSAPPTPTLFSTELDGQILLDWGNNADDVAKLENFDEKGFAFEGYNIYQLPSAGSSIDFGVRLATYDLSSDPTTITQQTFDPSSGQVLNLPVQFGKNTGITRQFYVTTDALRSLPLANGRTYYFAVTSYGYNADPAATSKALESTPAIARVTPQDVKPGTRYVHEIGDTRGVVHVGGSDGTVTVEISDPSKTTGHDYEVGFEYDTTYVAADTIITATDTTYVEAETIINTVWYVDDTTIPERKLSKQTNQSGDNEYITVDGMMIKVMGPADGFHGCYIVHDGTDAHPERNDDPSCSVFMDDVWNWEGHGTYDDLSKITIPPNGLRFWVTQGGGSPYSNVSYVARVLRNDNADRAIPYDFEWRWVGEGEAWALWGWYPDDGFASPYLKVNFEIWNIGIATPDDPSDDFQMVPRVYDVDASGSYNMWGDLDDSGGADDPGTDWVYWFDPPPGGYEAFAALAEADAAYDGASCMAGEVLARTVFMNHNGVGALDDSVPLSDLSSTDPANWTAADTAIFVDRGWFFDADNSLAGVTVDAENATANGVILQFPPAGAVYRWITNKPNLPGEDTFTFSTEAVTYSANTAKSDIKEINVFPNPYYGFNAIESALTSRFVTFSHLPEEAVIRIFTIAGVLVKTIEKDDPSQFITWDLENEDDLPVASGMYIVYVDMPGLGTTKILKVAIIREQQFIITY